MPMDIAIIILWIAEFILFILLFYFIENGDIEKYNDFLDCPFVKEFFFKKFNDVEKLRKVFVAFTVLKLLSDIFERVDKLLEAITKPVV